MSNDMSMDEMIEVLARYRYNAKHDADRIKALEAEASGLRAAVASLERVDNLLIKGLKDELNTLRASSFVTAVPVEEYEKLKAEVAKSEEHNAALCERLQDLNGEVHTASCTNARLHSQFANSEQENARLKAEVERLKGIILAQSSEFVRNATKQEEEPLHDGWNTGIAKACDLLAEKDKEIERLKAEVERLRKAGDNLERVLTDRSGSYEAGNASHEWNAAKEGKPSV